MGTTVELVKPREESARASSARTSSEAVSEAVDFYDAETLFAVWETSQKTVERLLPPPLQPSKRPLALALVATHPRTNFGPIYREAALAVRAELHGVAGFYFLAMPVTDDMAMVYGRELLGYPKKIADIAFYREGPVAGGWVQRHGTRYFWMQAQLTGAASTPDSQAALDEAFSLVGGSAFMITYSFKYFLAPNGDGFDYPPGLIREEVEYRPRAIECGAAKVVLKPSEFDPWSDVEVVRMLGAVYMRGTRWVRMGQVVSQVAPITLVPYSQVRVDLR